MKRWKKLLIVTGLILLIAAGIGYWAMNMAVNKVLDAISSDVMMSDVPSSLPPAPTGIVPSPSSTPAAATSEPSNMPSSVPQSADSPAPTTPAPSQAPIGSVKPTIPAETNAAPAASPYDGTIDASKAETAQESITMKEKMQVTSIFMKRFTTKELDAFVKLANGGLTVEEKKEAKKIVMEKLSEEEYDELIQIAAKLGLSQGKKYEESKKEVEPNKP